MTNKSTKVITLNDDFLDTGIFCIYLNNQNLCYKLHHGAFKCFKIFKFYSPLPKPMYAERLKMVVEIIQYTDSSPVSCSVYQGFVDLIGDKDRNQYEFWRISNSYSLNSFYKIIRRE